MSQEQWNSLPAYPSHEISSQQRITYTDGTQAILIKSPGSSIGFGNQTVGFSAAGGRDLEMETLGIYEGSGRIIIQTEGDANEPRYQFYLGGGIIIDPINNTYIQLTKDGPELKVTIGEGLKIAGRITNPVTGILVKSIANNFLFHGVNVSDRTVNGPNPFDAIEDNYFIRFYDATFYDAT